MVAQNERPGSVQPRLLPPAREGSCDGALDKKCWDVEVGIKGYNLGLGSGYSLGWVRSTVRTGFEIEAKKVVSGPVNHFTKMDAFALSAVSSHHIRGIT